MVYLAQIVWILILLNLNYLIKAENQDNNFIYTHTKNHNICKLQYNGAILANPNDCQKFYICDNQMPYEYNCDPNYHFDRTTRNCLPGTACSGNTTKPSAHSCSEGTVRAIQDDCYIFEACISGIFQQVKCPPNYYFYAPNSMCVPFKYDTQFKCSCLMPPHTVLENKYNCETYYVCENKKAILQKCPLGQYYNAQLNACVPDLKGVCLMKPTITPYIEQQLHSLHKDMNEVEVACALLGTEDIHFQTFPKECNTFYICINGQLYTQRCPHGLYYDSDKKYCVVDNSNKCKDNVEGASLITEENQGNKLYSKFTKF